MDGQISDQRFNFRRSDIRRSDPFPEKNSSFNKQNRQSFYQANNCERL
jgi:hypothetical protein